MSCYFYILCKYWKKHLRTAFALLFSGLLLTAIITLVFLFVREGINQEVESTYDYYGKYDVLLIVPDDLKSELVLPSKLAKNSKTDISDTVVKLGVEDLLGRYPSELSGGQQQRVAIARALVNDPSVLLCDEPTGNLDVATGNDVLSLLIDLNRNDNRTIIIVTHDNQLAEKCDRIIRISDGKIAE